MSKIVRKIKQNSGGITLIDGKRWIARWHEYSQNGDGTFTAVRKVQTIGRLPEMTRSAALETLATLVSPVLAASSSNVIPLILNPSAKGEISVARVELFFLENGIPVSIPRGNALPYDLIADIRGKLVRVQVKTGRTMNNGDIVFHCVSRRRDRTAEFYQGKADLFAVYHPHSKRLYGVRVEDCRSQSFVIPSSRNLEFLLSAWLANQIRSSSDLARRNGQNGSEEAAC